MKVVQRSQTKDETFPWITQNTSQRDHACLSTINSGGNTSEQVLMEFTTQHFYENSKLWYQYKSLSGGDTMQSGRQYQYFKETYYSMTVSLFYPEYGASK